MMFRLYRMQRVDSGGYLFFLYMCRIIRPQARFAPGPMAAKIYINTIEILRFK